MPRLRKKFMRNSRALREKSSNHGWTLRGWRRSPIVIGVVFENGSRGRGRAGNICAEKQKHGKRSVVSEFGGSARAASRHASQREACHLEFRTLPRDHFRIQSPAQDIPLSPFLCAGCRKLDKAMGTNNFFQPACWSHFSMARRIITDKRVFQPVFIGGCDCVAA